LLTISLTAAADEKRCPQTQVFFDARKHTPNYTANPRNPSPSNIDVKEVLIGYFGPSDATHAKGGDMWAAASLAIEQANRTGGFKGIPFRLVPAWSENPWGTGVAEVVRMAYVHKVWAIIGGIDGPSTHLAEQIVAKAHLTLLSSASTDKTVNLANVPWMFSTLPGDHLQAPVLADGILAQVGREPFVLVTATDHDSYLFTVELVKSFSKLQMTPSYHFEFKAGKKDFTALVEKIIHIQTDTLVLIAGAHDSAHLIGAVRKKGFSGFIFGGPQLGRHRFLKEIDRITENVVFPWLYVPNKNSQEFEKQFFQRFGRHPDYLAAHTYDTVNLLISAIRQAGLDRRRIRDAVRELSPFSGVTGTIKWDSLGGNSRTVRLGTIKSGQLGLVVEFP